MPVISHAIDDSPHQRDRERLERCELGAHS
jgi:hypothetical protein